MCRQPPQRAYLCVHTLQLDGIKAQMMTEELRAIDAEARADELDEQLEAERRDARAALDGQQVCEPTST